MDTLDRFLLKEFFAFFFVILIGLAFLYLGIDFFSKFWNMNMLFTRALELYAYRVPAALQTFVPVACLMATLLVLSSMSRQNEVLALYASGVGTLRLVSTFVAVVATVSTISFLVFDSLVPPLNKKINLMERGLDPTQDTYMFSPHGGFWYRSGHLIYNVGHFQLKDNVIDDLDVYTLTPDFRMKEKMHAQHASFDPKAGQWTFRSGYSVRYPPGEDFPEIERFVSRLGELPERPTDYKAIKIQEDMMRLRDLRKLISRNSDYGLDTTSQKVHYHERLAIVFTPLVFLLLGFPFALKPLRTPSMSGSVGFCFLLVFVYFISFRISLSIGKGGHIPPVVAAWAPNVIFLFLWGTYTARKR